MWISRRNCVLYVLLYTDARSWDLAWTTLHALRILICSSFGGVKEGCGAIIVNVEHSLPTNGHGSRTRRLLNEIHSLLRN